MYYYEIVDKMEALYRKVYEAKYDNYDKHNLTMFQEYPLSTFILDDKDKEFYDTLIFYAIKYNTLAAINFYTNNWYINEEDKERLYQAIINNVTFSIQGLKYDIFKNQEDLETYIMNSFNSYDNIDYVFTKSSQYLNDKIIDYALRLLTLVQKHQKIRFLLHVDKDYQLRVFNTLFTPYDYFSVYSSIIDQDRTNVVREKCFNYLIEHDEFVDREDFLDSHYYSFTDQEKCLLYRKYHDKLFKYSSYNDYRFKCKVFCDYISDEEKDVLIKHASTKTRYYQLKHLSQIIKFNEQQLARIKSIILMYEMKGE